MTPSLSIIVPILNEAENIPLLVNRVADQMGNTNYTIIFVDDDSYDGSREVLIDISKRNPRVRFLSRIDRQGLATAVIEGALSSSDDFIAVMDGDLQHDESLLPEMLATLVNEQADIVVGSRFAKGSSLGEFSETRERISRIGNWLSQSVIKSQLSDPLSGFFMLKRHLFESVVRNLSGSGFKILLDILSTIKVPVRVKELPFTFGTRIHGESKIDGSVTLEFGLMLLDKWFGGLIPARFIMFAAVGGLGVGIHLSLLALFYQALNAPFISAQIIATVLTMTVNFLLNNSLTFRDRRLVGGALFKGLLSFYLFCSIGALANFQLADFLFNNQVYWLLSGFAGAIVGAVWNYAMTSIFTWRKTKKHRL